MCHGGRNGHPSQVTITSTELNANCTHTHMFTNIKVKQANANRSRADYDILQVTAAEHEVDTVIVSELNKNLVRGNQWVKDNNVDMAVQIRNRNFEVRKVCKRDGWLALQLKSCKLVCVYVSHNLEKGNTKRK